MSETENVADIIRKVRAIEAKMDAKEAAFKEEMKPYKQYVEGKKIELLQHLLTSGQKNARTDYGTVYWKDTTTYRVEDKDEFKRHVIGMEQWELVTWGAAGNTAEAFTKEHGVPPPGCVRNSVRKVHILAPTKPTSARLKPPSEGAPLEEELPEAAE